MSRDRRDLTRREFGKGLLATAAAAIADRGFASAAGGPRPNFLVFVADDAGARHFGCYGNRGIRTPNIDRLSAQGLTADQAMLTTSQCSPSRISILTGRYPHSTGAEDLHMPLPSGHTTVAGHLRKARYFTGHMQKRHESRSTIRIARTRTRPSPRRTIRRPWTCRRTWRTRRRRARTWRTITTRSAGWTRPSAASLGS